VQSVGVVTDGDQQRAGAVSTDAKQRHQPWRRGAGELVQLAGERGDLGRQRLVAAGQDAQREYCPGSRADVVRGTG
jgi:hypothetical protein